MTRICFVSYEIHPTVKGGCGVLLHNAARALLPQGHEIIFLLDISMESFRQFDKVDRLDLPCSQNCRAYHVASLTTDLRYTQNDFRSTFEYSAYQFHIALSKVYDIEKPDIIEFFEYCGIGYFALNAKISGLGYQESYLALRLHNSLEIIDSMQPGNSHSIDRYLMYGLEHQTLQLAETVLYPSNKYLEEIYHPRYEPWFGNTIYSPPPLIDKLEPDGAPQNQNIILFYGRLVGFKGVDTFLDAAILYLSSPDHPRRMFYLVGYDSFLPPGPSGSYQEYLKSKIPSQFQDSFIFTGYLNRQEVGKLLPNVLFAMVPSYLESFCYAAHELYAAGIPLIVSDIPAFRGYFQHEENALLFDGTISDLARQMERLSIDDELRKSIAFPHPVTQMPLGDFYSTSQFSSWIKPRSTDTVQPSLLLCLICDQRDIPTGMIHTIRASLPEKSFIVIIRPADTSNEREIVAWFLGQLYSFEDENGQPLAPTQIFTQETLLLIRASDILEKRYFDIGLDILARQSQIAFVGSWRRIRNGDTYRIETFPYDVSLELLPLIGESLYSRFIFRTTRGQLLIDLFDPRAGRLGEAAYLWKLNNGERCGLIIPEPLITQEIEVEHVLDSSSFDYLILQDENPWRKKRLVRYLLTLKQRSSTLAAPKQNWAVTPQKTVASGTLVDKLRASRLNLWLNRNSRYKSTLYKLLGGRKR